MEVVYALVPQVDDVVDAAEETMLLVDDLYRQIGSYPDVDWDEFIRTVESVRQQANAFEQQLRSIDNFFDV